jgi:hypothetical protein
MQKSFFIVALIGLISINFAVPQLSFVSPTPSNATNTTNSSFLINTTITEQNIENISIYWNATNHSFYDSSLVLMLNLDNSSAIGETTSMAVDVSKYGNNATTFAGDATWSANGKYGGAIELDGNGDYISIPASASLNSWTNKITISAWLYPRSLTGYRMIAAQREGSGSWQFFAAHQDYGGRIAFSFWDTGGSEHTCDSGLSLTQNEWAHVSVVYDGSAVTIYKNGIAGSACAQSTQMRAESSATRIGNEFYSGYFDGLIDEVRIYNKSVDENFIRQVYATNLKKQDLENWSLEANETLASPDSPSFSSEYSVCASDIAGNINCTEHRTIRGIGDETAPQISFVSPTPSDGETSITANILINTSISESNPKNISFFWNGTNYSLYDSSLIMMYNFDNVSELGEDSTTAKDFSFTNLTGTFNSATLGEGKYGLGATFDQTGYFDTGTTLSTLIDNFTISFWVNPNATQTSNADIFGNHGGAQTGIVMQSDGTNNDYRFVYGDGSNWPATDPITLTDEVWQYITIVKNATTCQIYHNGELNLSNSCNTPVSPSPGNLFLGQGVYTNHFIRLFNGHLDEFRIYNRTLEAGEINQAYKTNLRKYSAQNWSLEANETLAGPNQAPMTVNYSACATDMADNLNCTSSRTINSGDGIVPTITITHPVNSQYFNYSAGISINLTVTDLASGVNTSSCTYSLDGAGPTLIPLCENTIFNSAEGRHNISISAKDLAGNQNILVPINFTIDLSEPTITLINPANGSMDSAGSKVFSFNVTDALSTTLNCTIYLNGINQTNLEVESSSITNWTSAELASSAYNWSVSCNDQAGNTNTSEAYAFQLQENIAQSNEQQTQTDAKKSTLEMTKQFDCREKKLTIYTKEHPDQGEEISAKLIGEIEVQEAKSDYLGKIEFNLTNEGTYKIRLESKRSFPKISDPFEIRFCTNESKQSTNATNESSNQQNTENNQPKIKEENNSAEQEIEERIQTQNNEKPNTQQNINLEENIPESKVTENKDAINTPIFVILVLVLLIGGAYIFIKIIGKRAT